MCTTKEKKKIIIIKKEKEKEKVKEKKFQRVGPARKSPVSHDPSQSSH